MYRGGAESSAASGYGFSDTGAALSPNPSLDSIFGGLDEDNTTYLDRSTSSVGYSTLAAPATPATELHAALQDPEQLRNIPFHLLMAQDGNVTSSWMPSEGFTHTPTDAAPKTDTQFPAPKRQRLAPSGSSDDLSILPSAGSIHPGIYALRRASWTFGQPHYPSSLQSISTEAPRQMPYLTSSEERSDSSEPLSPVRERSQELPVPSRSALSVASMMGPPSAVIGAVSSVKARANQKKRKRAEEEQAKVVAEESRKNAAIAAAAAASKKKVDDGPIKPPPHIIEMVHHRQMQRAAAREFLRRATPGAVQSNSRFPSTRHSNSVDEDAAACLGGYPVWMYHPGVSTQVPYSSNPSKSAQSSGPMHMSQDVMGRRYSWHAGAHGLSSMMPPATPYSFEHDRLVDATMHPRHPVATADE